MSIDAEVHFNARTNVAPVTFAPGDTIDLAGHGIIVWYSEEDAEAYRLMQRKRQRETRSVIEHVEKGKHQ